MVNISKMARAAGIGSAVGATIGGIKESRDKDGDILGGIVGGAFVGSIGGAGISAGKQYLQAKKLARVSGSDIADVVTKQAATPRVSQPQQSVQSNVINNAQDLNVAKNVMNFKVGDSSISISKLSNPNSLSGSQIKELAHMDAINYRSQLRGIDNLSEKDMQNATNIASLKLSSQFNDVDMQRKYQNYFHEGIEGSIARESKYTTKQVPIQDNNTPNRTNKDLKVAEQVSKATAGNTAPIREFSDFELESSVADMDAIRGAYDAGYSYKEAGLGDYRDYMRRSKNVYGPDTYQQLYDHPGASFDSSDENYVSGVKDAIRHRLNNKPITNVQNKTIENVVDDYYGHGTANDLGDTLKDFKETKTFRKWYISDPYSDGEIGTDLEIRQRKSDGTFEARRHGFFCDDPEYYSKPTKWEPYKFS